MNKRQAIMKMITDNPHLSVSELSKRTGLSRTVFYKWKEGHFDNIQIKSVQAVADATGTNIKIDGDNIEIVDDIVIKKENDMNVEASYIIDLQKEKIEYLEQQLKTAKAHPVVKPAYHFKSVSKFEHEMDIWYTPLFTGDVSMTGYTLDELHTLCDDNKTFWIDRYHPDSLIRLEAVQLSAIRTDYHYLKWDHMMWKCKNGKYECYNIDQVYSKADQEVTAMFYWVNGNKD